MCCSCLSALAEWKDDERHLWAGREEADSPLQQGHIADYMTFLVLSADWNGRELSETRRDWTGFG